MHITRLETQNYVNRFLPEIRSKAGINIEDILVREENIFDKTDRVTSTEPGIIHIYPRKDYSPLYVNVEKSVLHALGHRAIGTINPQFYEGLHRQAGYDFESWNILKTIARVTLNSLNGKVFIPHAIQEGLAEYLSLEIFPKICSISDGKSFIEDARINAGKGIFIRPNRYFSSEEKLIAKSYKFFDRIYQVGGLDGIKDYVKNAPTYKLPKSDDWDCPLLYLKEQGSKTRPAI